MTACQRDSPIPTSWHWLPRVGKELLPPNYGVPEERSYPWEGGGGKRQKYRCSAAKRWRAPRQVGCTLLWGVSSITRGLHGQADGLLPPNISFQCHKTSVE